MDVYKTLKVMIIFLHHIYDRKMPISKKLCFYWPDHWALGLTNVYLDLNMVFATSTIARPTLDLELGPFSTLITMNLSFAIEAYIKNALPQTQGTLFDL